MLKIKEAIIVEGKYDKIKLGSIVDAPIIETNGFRVFSDKEKQSLIRKIAQVRGILVLTDSDGAGFVIRNFLKGAVDKSKIKHCYIPQIKGKEKRKPEKSKEGFLGVEGVSNEIIVEAIKKSGATVIADDTKSEQKNQGNENFDGKGDLNSCNSPSINGNGIKNGSEEPISPRPAKKHGEITKADLFYLGLTGAENSDRNRKRLLKHLDLPTYLSTNAMLTVLNCLYSLDELQEIISEL